jgi:LmbE family N-acetylglucosaminyl deacetylase
VLAHPDDESIACGGTLAMLADLGARVVVLCATRGERGSAAGPRRDDVLGTARTREAIDAARALGISDLVVLDHPDGDLRWAHVTELSAEIVMAIERFRPVAVITFGADGLYWHLDHIGIHERTTTAVRSLGASAPPLYYVTMPRGAVPGIVECARARGWTPPLRGLWSLIPDAWGIGANPAEIVVDVRAWVPQKVAAIRSHQTQVGPAGVLATVELADAVRWLGIEHFHRAADIAPGCKVLEPLGVVEDR